MVMKYLRTNVRWIMITVVALFVVSCFAGYGMYSRGQGQGGGMRDYAVAEAGGKKIMRSSLEKGMQEMAEQFGNQQITSADLPLLRKAVLDNIVVSEQLLREVENPKITVGDDEVATALHPCLGSVIAITGHTDNSGKEPVTENTHGDEEVAGVAGKAEEVELDNVMEL